MFLLALIVLFAAEIAALIEVGHAIGWLWTVPPLFGTSFVGWQLLRIQGARGDRARLGSRLGASRARSRGARRSARIPRPCALLVVPVSSPTHSGCSCCFY